MLTLSISRRLTVLTGEENIYAVSKQEGWIWSNDLISDEINSISATLCPSGKLQDLVGMKRMRHECDDATFANTSRWSHGLDLT